MGYQPIENYGVVGDAPANSNSDGRAYGFEVSVRVSGT